MKKQITLTIEEAAIITNPPQPGVMKINIEGLQGIEVVMLLISAASQISGQQFPPLIEAMKKAEKEINPMMQVTGKA